MDKLYKIIFNDDLRIHMAEIEDLTSKIYFPEEYDIEENKVESVSATAIAAVLASDLKEANSSITVMLRNVSRGVSYSVTAQQDGRVCGSVGGYSKGVLKDGYILEVIRRSGIGKDYSSVVCGENIEAVIDEYITVSMQRKAILKIYGNLAVLAEELPFTNIIDQGKLALEVLKDNSSPTALKESDGFRFVEESDLIYGCTCTKRSVKKALIAAVAGDDFDSLDDEIEVRCKLCGKKYIIEKSEL